MKQYEATYKDFTFIGPSPIDFDKKVERSKLPWAKRGEDNDRICVWEELCHLSLDKLMKSGKRKIGVVFNLDRYDEPGSHWVSLYISLEERPTDVMSKQTGGSSGPSIEWPNLGGKNRKAAHPTPFIFYFDSTGSPPPMEIKKFIHRIKKQGKLLSPPLDIVSYNSNGRNHQRNNTECGMYSLFFLITMLTGNLEKDKSTKVLDFDEKIKLFRNANIPDKYVEMYRHTYFNTPVH
jgi:hypothetical protein